jgi:hypothetical protein
MLPKTAMTIMPPQRTWRMMAFQITMSSAPFSLGSQPQKRPQDWSAQMPPRTEPESLFSDQVPFILVVWVGGFFDVVMRGGAHVPVGIRNRSDQGARGGTGRKNRDLRPPFGIRFLEFSPAPITLRGTKKSNSP